jgi:hypothetical protein
MRFLYRHLMLQIGIFAAFVEGVGILICLAAILNFAGPPLQLFTFGGRPAGPFLSPLLWLLIGAPMSYIGDRIRGFCVGTFWSSI